MAYANELRRECDAVSLSGIFSGQVDFPSHGLPSGSVRPGTSLLENPRHRIDSGQGTVHSAQRQSRFAFLAKAAARKMVEGQDADS